MTLTSAWNSWSHVRFSSDTHFSGSRRKMKFFPLSSSNTWYTYNKQRKKTIHSVSHFSLNVEKSIKKVLKGIYKKNFELFHLFFLQINYGK